MIALPTWGALFLCICAFTEIEVSKSYATIHALHASSAELMKGRSFQATASSEFEGKITIVRYAVTADGRERQVSQTPLLIHPDYIYLEALDGTIELMGAVKADGVLVRQRHEDFVILTTERQAVTMNKQELQQMMSMLETMRGQQTNEAINHPAVSIQETDEHQDIEGMQARKSIVKHEDSVTEWHVWVTDNLSVPWGMVSESWLIRYTFFSDLPSDWLNDNKLPLRAELYHDGKLAEVFRIEDISAESLHESMFMIPEGYQRLNFQQLLFDRMRNR
ncbi:MAG: hypothetical protein WD097_05980 [Balneolales bacterium]